MFFDQPTRVDHFEQVWRTRAIYATTPAQAQIKGTLYRLWYASLGIQPGLKRPDSVNARVVDGRILYVNSTDGRKDVELEGMMTGLRSGKKWTGSLGLGPFEVDFLTK